MRPEPVATYRVQLRREFGFAHARQVLDYLSRLGVSHLYTSPYLQATRGSAHGYDVVDPGRVNEELGGASAHAKLCEALLASGLGQMIDVVPNHLAIAGADNPWWWDVLENGPSSRFASYFDVDWEASEERWPNKILLPVLGDHYGRVLEESQLALTQEQGRFVLRYYEHAFPIDPSSLAPLLGKAAEACGSEQLAFFAESHARLPRPTVTAPQSVDRRHRDKAVLADLILRLCREEPQAAHAIDAEVAHINADPEELDRLIERQNYRLSFWRTASRDLGYRRFFDINDLAGMRVEDLEVFEATHALPLAWVKKGWVHGIRVDHPDGLRDPTQYFHRLRENCPHTWIVAEKILESGEALPPDWPIAGTTGYDFLNLVGGLFVDPSSEPLLTRFYEELSGEQTDFDSLVRKCKRLVLDELLAAELNRLTSLFVAVCERHRRHRDYTRYDLRESLCEVAIHFPVYRSYVQASSALERMPTGAGAGAPGGANRSCDQAHIEQAIAAAKNARSDLAAELFDFLEAILLRRIDGSLECELAMRLPQLTGAAMAKGVEDTAFYRFHRLVALNEVGGDPRHFGTSLDKFHDTCADALATRPMAMLASTTHDTKRSEDVRLRLAVLSEVPECWVRTVQQWMENNRQHQTGELLDRNTEYLLYQTLVGAWPIDLERASAYMEKAVREAKVHTSWTQQNQDYERALAAFIEAILNDSGFVKELDQFVSSLLHAGRINSLAQTLLKLTAPGVPDIYQGSELWDLSLVDPDNRRPVDFEHRKRLLNELATLSPEEILLRMDEGLPKLWVIERALRLRRQFVDVFQRGSYRPLLASGSKAQHVVAFSRGGHVITVVPRWTMRLQGDWADTSLQIPEQVGPEEQLLEERWRNVLTGESWQAGVWKLGGLLARCPVGLFLNEGVAKEGGPR